MIVQRCFRVVVVVGVGMLFLVGCGVNLSGEPKIVATIPPATPALISEDLGYPTTPPDLAQGAAIFAEHCTACHGVGGMGDGELVKSGQVPAMTSFTDASQVPLKYPTDYFSIITQGNIEKLMPPWANTLNEQERWAVAMYVYTLRHTAEIRQTGEALYATHCEKCHGAGGLGDGEQARLDGVDPSNLASPESMVTLTDDAIYNIILEGIGSMNGLRAELTDEEAQALVAYTRTLSVSNAEAMGSVAEAPASKALAVSGQVTNGTAGSTLTTPLDVQLSVIKTDSTIEDVAITQTDTDGNFSFEAILIEPEMVYFTSTTYNERIFTSEPILVERPEDALDLPIRLYDLTDDPSVIQIERYVVQLRAFEDGLQVAEFVFLRNTSDRVFTQSTPIAPDSPLYASATLTLPPGAIIGGTGGNQSTRYQVDQENFRVTDTQPIVPDVEHLMQVVYFLPFEDSAIIEHELNYLLNGEVRLLVAPTDLQVQSQQLPFLREEVIGTQTYNTYGGSMELLAQDVISYDVKWNTGAVAIPFIRHLPTLLFIIAGLSGLTAVILFFVGRTRNTATSHERQIQELVKQIAQLDQQHESGTLNHDLWYRQRAKLKEQLTLLVEETEEQA